MKITLRIKVTILFCSSFVCTFSLKRIRCIWRHFTRHNILTFSNNFQIIMIFLNFFIIMQSCFVIVVFITTQYYASYLKRYCVIFMQINLLHIRIAGHYWKQKTKTNCDKPEIIILKIISRRKYASNRDFRFCFRSYVLFCWINSKQ